MTEYTNKIVELIGAENILYAAVLAVAVMLIIIMCILRHYTRKRNRFYTDRELENTLPKEYPYKRRNLLTRPEYDFYLKLKEKADKAELTVFTKVRLEDIVEVHNTKEINRYRGYIKNRHVDFVLCDSNLKVAMCIELDDKSHKKNKRNDTLKNNVLEAADIPLTRIKVGADYNKVITDIIRKVA